MSFDALIASRPADIRYHVGKHVDTVFGAGG
jgi:hypothetical protein